MSMLEILSGICLFAGSIFGVIGAVGVLRFPEFYTRLHAAGITDTLCAALILGGLMLQAEALLTVVKLLLVLAFLLFTTPTATHALARSALQTGNAPCESSTRKSSPGESSTGENAPSKNKKGSANG